ncbi:hypothetical protein GCM10027449_27100 [Sinomonas notoginsengisoli]
MAFWATRPVRPDSDGVTSEVERRRPAMSKRARKRRDRKRGGANHGKRPNT